MHTHEYFMQRCLQLADNGAGYVAPNPLVGAVLVYKDRIIGEGYHAQFGQAHAEVNCLASVADADKGLIAESTMYVSLEPCAHFGKTPPCANLLIAEKIKKVVIACRDPFAAVDGKGIELLKAAGVEVVCGVLEKEAAWQNRRFFTFHARQRPYIILKWAQSKDGFMGKPQKRTAISNASSSVMVHQWRSQEAAIMVGTQTALTDNPQLNNRLYCGPSPVRIVIDRHLKVPSTSHLHSHLQPTVIFNYEKVDAAANLQWVRLKKDEDEWQQILDWMYSASLQSVLVEGGGRLLQSIIETGHYDEIRVITNEDLLLVEGIAAPVVHNLACIESYKIATDKVAVFTHQA